MKFIKVIVLSGENLEIESPALINLEAIEQFRKNEDGKISIYYKDQLNEEGGPIHDVLKDGAGAISAALNSSGVTVIDL